MNNNISIKQAVDLFIELNKDSRSDHTARTYSNALSSFLIVIHENGKDLEDPIVSLGLDELRIFLTELKYYAPATEQVYIVAVNRFYHFLVAEEYLEINLERVKMLIQTRSRRPGIRLPQFPKDDIEKVINFSEYDLPRKTSDDEQLHLRNLRDAAFILTLADTGLRVHEACALRRGDIDWQEFKAVVIGKGDRQAVVRFSSRAIHAIKAYLQKRALADGASNRPLPALPLFARHDKGAGKKIKPISTATGRNIVNFRVEEVLGDKAVGTITPHSFRHYFVTNILQGSGGNLKLAQELARHQNIQVTQRYAHLSDDELDRGYHDVFENDSDKD